MNGVEHSEHITESEDADSLAKVLSESDLVFDGFFVEWLEAFGLWVQVAEVKLDVLLNLGIG